MKIPKEGKITALPDVFDALTSKWPYKEARNIETTMQYMRERDKVLEIEQQFPDN